MGGAPGPAVSLFQRDAGGAGGCRFAVFLRIFKRDGRPPKPGRVRILFNLLLLSVALVFTASNAFFFLVAWEVMALAAYCLVSFEYEKKRRAMLECFS